MSIRRAALKGTALVGAGRMLDRGLQFGRNIIVARLLSPEDFGIAALFAMTISLLEMISNLAVGTLLIQSPRGDEPEFQQTSQLMMVVRGFLLGAVIFLFAGPVARLFDVPQSAWAFRLLAVVPMIRGLAHTDIIRMQRQMNFKPSIVMDVSSQLFSFVFAWPLASWLGNYSAILYLILIQTLSRTVMSHFMAERSYRWTWEPQHARHIISFGWPLLINGLLMFAIFQGDRFVIGAANRLFEQEVYSKAILGIYSIAAILSTIPEEGLSSILSPVILPLLSKAQNCWESFRRIFSFTLCLLTFFAIPFALAFALLGGWMVTLIYGEQYSGAGLLVFWLGISQSLRLARQGLSLGAIAKGETIIPMITNIVRSMAFAACFIFTYLGKPIEWLAAASLGGEVLAFGAGVILVRLRLRIPFSAFAGTLISLGVCVIAILIYYFSGLLNTTGATGIVVLMFTVTIINSGMLVFIPELRTEVLRLLRFKPILLEKLTG